MIDVSQCPCCTALNKYNRTLKERAMLNVIFKPSCSQKNINVARNQRFLMVILERHWAAKFHLDSQLLISFIHSYSFISFLLGRRFLTGHVLLKLRTNVRWYRTQQVDGALHVMVLDQPSLIFYDEFVTIEIIRLLVF